MADQDTTLVVRVLTFCFVMFKLSSSDGSCAVTPTVHAVPKVTGMVLGLTG